MRKKRNMHQLDRIFRSVMGLALIYLGLDGDALTSDVLSRVLLAMVGVFTLSSAISGYCSIYHFSGISTYKENKDE